MSNVYFTSDTHFGHRNIIDYTERPFTGVDDMDEWLILNWNETVQPDDTVWYLGDFALGPSIDRMLEVLCQLNGHKFCILGNHDERTIARKSSLFTGPNLFESIYPGIVEHIMRCKFGIASTVGRSCCMVTVMARSPLI